MSNLGGQVTRHTCTYEHNRVPRASGSAAGVAEARKTVKYQLISQTHTFVSLAFETLGAWGEQATEFMTVLGRWLTLVSGNGSKTFYSRQRLSIAIQRGNAIACLGSLPQNILLPTMAL